MSSTGQMKSVTGTIYKDPAYKKRILELYDQKLHTFHISYKEIDIKTSAGNTHVVVAGDPGLPKVVLLHGLNSGAPTALEPVQGLADKYCIYAIDIIGQSNKSDETRLSVTDDSYAVWLAETLDGLGLAKATIIGVSYGAFILQRLIKYRPERIQCALFVVPSGIVNGSPIKSIFKLLIPMRRFFKTGKEEDLVKFMDAFYTSKDEYSRQYQRATLEGIYMDMRRPPLLRKKDTANFHAPVYVLAADDDVFFPGDKTIQICRKLFDNLKDTILLGDAKHVPDAGHYAKIEGILRSWLDRESGGL